MDIGQRLLWHFTLLIGAFTVKQFLADFPLQSNWMARGKERREGWHGPLAAHAGVHGALTTLIALAIAPHLWWFGVVDFVIHGCIDRGKTIISAQMRLSTSDIRFWILFGLDQCLHHLTGLFLAYGLMTS